jgi:hypothetical protein
MTSGRPRWNGCPSNKYGKSGGVDAERRTDAPQSPSEKGQAGMRQWCVVRSCVALADSPDVPYLCRIHEAMGRVERVRWSQEHSFNLPVLRPVTDGRIVYQRSDGSCFRIGPDGEAIEEKF